MASDFSVKKIREEFKSKGVFYTPPELIEFLKKYITIKDFKTVYDPTCGRGNLLSWLDKNILKYGQDIDGEAIEYCINNIPNFKGVVGSTLEIDGFKGMKFDLILANPPFSIKYDPEKTKGDERFSCLPCLAPPSKADYMFIADIIHKLNDKGQAIVIEFPGVLYRKAKEGDIRKWLVDNNYIDTIIAIPPNMFTDTTIATVALILKKNKATTDIKFVDIANELEHIAKREEIKKNDYILSVSNYCQKIIEKEYIDGWELEKACRLASIKRLARDIELSCFVSDFEGWEVKSFLEDLKKVIENKKIELNKYKTNIKGGVGELREKQLKYVQGTIFDNLLPKRGEMFGS